MAETSQAEKALSQAKDSRPVYEVGFHIIPTVPEEGVGAVVEKVRAMLGSAEVLSEQFPQKMTLAYTIERSMVGKVEKYDSAYFGVIKFVVAERSEIPAIEEQLRADSQILRYLLIETVREGAQPSRRAVFTSNRLEGETIKKPAAPVAEKKADVSEEELDKSIEALVS